jgi:hypothetical protein
MNGPILNMQLREKKRKDGDKEQEKQGQPDRLEVAATEKMVGMAKDRPTGSSSRNVRDSLKFLLLFRKLNWISFGWLYQNGYQSVWRTPKAEAMYNLPILRGILNTGAGFSLRQHTTLGWLPTRWSETQFDQVALAHIYSFNRVLSLLFWFMWIQVRSGKFGPFLH